jgi:hypothetical protein
MLSSAAAQPAQGGPSAQQGLLGANGGAAGADLLGGFPRAGSSGGLMAPSGASQLQLQQELLSGASTGPSPANSLTNTPRTLSSALGMPSAAGPTPDAAAMGMGNVGAGGKGWSSLDGMPRPNWQQQLGANPSDAILGGTGGQPYGGAGAAVQRPPSTGPTAALSSSFDGTTLSRGNSAASPNPLAGLPSHMQLQGQQPQRLPSLPTGLPSTQQQLLQQHLAQQQAARAQSLPPAGYGQGQQGQAASLANLQAAQQAVHAAQAAQNVLRQQALRNVSLAADDCMKPACFVQRTGDRASARCVCTR